MSKVRDFVNACVNYEEDGRCQNVRLSEDEWMEVALLVKYYDEAFGSVGEAEVETYWFNLEAEATVKAWSLFDKAKKELMDGAWKLLALKEEVDLPPCFIEALKKTKMYKLGYFSLIEAVEFVDEEVFMLRERGELE